MIYYVRAMIYMKQFPGYNQVEIKIPVLTYLLYFLYFTSIYCGVESRFFEHLKNDSH